MRRFSGITRLQPKAAPLLMMSGWNDDLFPPEQTARSYRILRKAHGDSYVHLQWGDVGHPRAQNKHNTYVLFNKQVHNFFDHFLKGEGKRGVPKNGGVTAMTTTCPEKAPANGPFRASDLDKLSKAALEFGSSPSQKLTSTGGSKGVDEAFTPIFGTLKACKKIPQVIAPGDATYQLAVKDTFTMLGLPTVRSKIKTKGPFGQLDASLLDVAPKGTPAAGGPGGRAPAAQPARPDDLPDERQRLPLQEGPHHPAGPLRARPHVPPPEQRQVHRPGQGPADRAADQGGAERSAAPPAQALTERR